VVLVVAGEFEQLPVEKSEICIAPPDQLFDLPQSEYPATKEVRRDALLTGRQAVPACSGGAVAEEVKRDALRTVDQPYRLALPLVGSRRGKAGRFTYCRPAVLGLLRRAR
jgi:hypothetical protein